MNVAWVENPQISSRNWNHEFDFKDSNTSHLGQGTLPSLFSVKAYLYLLNSSSLMVPDDWVFIFKYLDSLYMKTRILWIMNNPEHEYGLSLRQVVWIWHHAFEAFLGLYCREWCVYKSAFVSAYFKGQCPGEANTGSGSQCCYGGHSQSRVCDHMA